MATHIPDQALRALLRAYCAGPRCLLTRRLAATRPRVQSRSFRLAAAYTTVRPLQRASIEQPRHRFHLSRQSYATTSTPQEPQQIAVLGGGLTGLTTAYYLTKFHPNAKITLYEETDRLGGWVDTEEMEVRTKAGRAETIHFEHGPRVVAPQNKMARYEDLVLYDLV